MKTLLFSVSTAFFIFFMINAASSLQCFSCYAQRNTSNTCEANLSESLLVNCTEGNYTHCITIYTNNTIKRNCSMEHECNQLNNETEKCNVCLGNKCNNDSYSTPNRPISNTNQTISNPNGPNVGTNISSYNPTQSTQNKTLTGSKPSKGNAVASEGIFLSLLITSLLSLFLLKLH